MFPDPLSLALPFARQEMCSWIKSGKAELVQQTGKTNVKEQQKKTSNTIFCDADWDQLCQVIKDRDNKAETFQMLRVQSQKRERSSEENLILSQVLILVRNYGSLFQIKHGWILLIHPWKSCNCQSAIPGHIMFSGWHESDISLTPLGNFFILDKNMHLDYRMNF